MKVLVVGGGGREHAIVWKLSQSPKVKKIYCAPGNGGISQIAECLPIGAMEIEKIVEAAKAKDVDLVVVAPDDPLAAGLVDTLEEQGIRAFGPSKVAAEIEASKVFSKNLMKKYNIPTAQYEVFSDYNKAIEYLMKQSYPIVIKADGLALGKGVIIAENFKEAKEAVNDMINNNKFGKSGSNVVIENFIVGPEVSVLAFTDGNTIVPMVSAQDHKRAKDNDKGLNTGGMGAFSPSRIYSKELAEECMKNIFIPSMEAMNSEGRKFKGILFFGLMLTKDGPRLLEYNSRFGDPEAQVVLPRLKGDLVEIFNAIIDERLDEVKIEWEDNAAVCVVIASGGYPVKYVKEYEISGLEDIKDEETIVFHAGTKKVNSIYLTNGGRVLGVTAVGDNLDLAIEKAYDGVRKINFKDSYYRKDIGIKK